MSNPTVQANLALVLWRPLTLIIPALGIGLIALYFRPRRRSTFAPGRSRRRHPRHIAVRIICGFIGIGILVALGVGALREVRGVQALFHLPTKHSPVLPEPIKDKNVSSANVDKTDVKARLLVHFIFFRNEFPVHAEEVEVHLPADRGREFRKTGELGALDFDISLRFEDLEAFTRSANGPQEQYIGAKYRLSYGTDNTLGGGFGLFSPGDLRNYGDAKKIDILESRDGQTTIQVVCLARLIALDDPLKTARFSELLVQDVNWNHRNFLASGSSGLVESFDGINSAGFQLMKHARGSFVLLMLAALFLSQCFTRRGLAFAGMLALCVLYVATLERAELAMHVSRLENRNLSIDTRLAAAESLSETFFYRRSAAEALVRNVNDQTIPECWRQCMLMRSNDLKTPESR
jgi:hypothetical protein